MRASAAAAPAWAFTSSQKSLMVSGVISSSARAQSPPAPQTAHVTRRDCFNDPLPAGALARMGTVRFRHKAGGTAVFFLPNGRELVTAADDGSLRFWDRASGRQLRSFKGHKDTVEWVAFAPGGRRLVSCGDGIKVWELDAAAGKSTP